MSILFTKFINNTHISKNLFFIAVIAVASIFTSCKKEEIDVNLDEIVLNHKSVGSLSVTIIDAENNPLPDATIKLSPQYTSYYGAIEFNPVLEEIKTDANGVANFGLLNSGNYSITGLGIKDGDYEYNILQLAQIVSGTTKTINIVPSEFSGKLTLSLFEIFKSSEYYYSDPEELKTGKVALVKKSNAGSRFDLQTDIFMEAALDGSSNTIVLDKVPTGDYRVIIYNDKDHYTVGMENFYNHEYNSLDINVDKDAEIEIDVFADGEKLTDIIIE